MLKLKYFSWVRERVGVEEEDIELPDHVHTLGELLAWQSTRGEAFEQAFADQELIRVAVDMQHVTDLGLDLSQAKEVAMFPPMTGG